MLADSLTRVPASSRQRALEVGTAASSPALGGFQSLENAPVSALADLPPGEFNFIAAIQVACEIPILMIRESARLLREHGVLCARLSKVFSRGDLTDLARDLDFQVCVLDVAASLSIIWRKRAPGWRVNLTDHAALASARIVRIVNAWDHSPVVPNRGRYATLSILVDGLPTDVDLLDLEILIGGVRATASSISQPDARGQQQVVAQFSLEQTGLVPVELHWFGQHLTSEPTYVRVIPAGPIVPRIVSVASGASRVSGITISIDELARPDELTATIDGEPIWGVETVCVDSSAQHYSVLLRIADEVEPGVHEIQLIAGRRKLAPISIEIQ